MSWKCPKKAKPAQSLEAAPAIHQMMVRWEPCGENGPTELIYSVKTRNRFAALATGAPPVTPTQALNFLDSASPQLNSVGSEEFLDLEVVLDSGACEHVVDSSMTPGYQVLESEGSRSRLMFSRCKWGENAQSRRGPSPIELRR